MLQRRDHIEGNWMPTQGKASNKLLVTLLGLGSLRMIEGRWMKKAMFRSTWTV